VEYNVFGSKIWNINENSVKSVRLSDQLLELAGFAYSQTTRTVVILVYNGTIFSVDKSSGKLNLFSNPPSNSEPIAMNSLVVDNQGNALWFLTQDSLVRVDLKTSKTKIVPISDTHGVYMILNGP